MNLGILKKTYRIVQERCLDKACLCDDSQIICAVDG